MTSRSIFYSYYNYHNYIIINIAIIAALVSVVIIALKEWSDHGLVCFSGRLWRRLFLFCVWPVLLLYFLLLR